MKYRLTLTALLLLMASIAAAQTVKSDWRFPSPDIPAKYDSEMKTDVYDLGNSFTAVRKKLGKSDVVIVGFRAAPEEIADADFALAVASKVLRLPKLLKETVLEQKDDFEFLFRTASGNTAGVTLAHDRKSAVVRLLPVEMQ